MSHDKKYNATERDDRMKWNRCSPKALRLVCGDCGLPTGKLTKKQMGALLKRKLGEDALDVVFKFKRHSEFYDDTLVERLNHGYEQDRGHKKAA